MLTEKKAEELKQLAVQPLEKRIEELKDELEAAYDTAHKYKTKFENLNKQYDKETDETIKEVTALKEGYLKREKNRDDMLDRFASKNFENGKRGSYNQIHFTDYRKINLRRGYKEAIGFTILYPFPTGNSIKDVGRIAEHIATLTPNIAKEIGVDEVEFISASIKSNGWLAKFEVEL